MKIWHRHFGIHRLHARQHVARPWPAIHRFESHTVQFPWGPCNTHPSHENHIHVSAIPVGSGGDPDLRDAIKRLKKAFYQGEEEAERAVPKESEDAQKLVMECGAPNVIRDFPIWMVDWAVVPGMQCVFSVQLPGTVHMFETVFSRGRPWRFGVMYQADPAGRAGTEGRAAAATCSGAPGSVGVLMEVNRAVRMMDGKLTVLATAVSRIQVLHCHMGVSFPRAEVQLLPDDEELQQLKEALLQAGVADAAGWPSGLEGGGPGVAQAASSSSAAEVEAGAAGMPEGASVERLMQALVAGAHAAAAASSRVWEEYEYAISRKQQWEDDCPKEGTDNVETQFLVTWVVGDGVKEMLPLPDGPVLGRWDLVTLGARADAEALAQGLARARAVLHTELNASVQGGYLPELMQANNGTAVEGADESQAAAGEVSGPGEQVGMLQSPLLVAEPGNGSQDQQDLLQLEAQIWEELDTSAALTLRARKQHLTLPLGLLQLRPPSPPPSPPSVRTASHQTSAPVHAGVGQSSREVAAAAPAGLPATPSDPPASSVAASGLGSGSASATAPAGPSSRSGSVADQQSSAAASKNGGSSGLRPGSMPLPPPSSSYRGAASNGSEAVANPDWPALRRMQKLTWAIAAIFLGGDGPQQMQAMLECTSVRGRLRMALSHVMELRNTVVAMAAMAGLRKPQDEGPNDHKKEADM